VLGVTVIHTTIGGGLDEMTSADDFHLISWRNFLGLSAIVIGVLIPVGLRYFLRRGAVDLADVEQIENGDIDEENEDPILAMGPRTTNKGKTTKLDDEAFDDFFDDDADSDIILEAGPALAPNDDDDSDSGLSHSSKPS